MPDITEQSPQEKRLRRLVLRRQETERPRLRIPRPAATLAGDQSSPLEAQPQPISPETFQRGQLDTPWAPGTVIKGPPAPSLAERGLGLARQGLRLRVPTPGPLGPVVRTLAKPTEFMGEKALGGASAALEVVDKALNLVKAYPSIVMSGDREAAREFSDRASKVVMGTQSPVEFGKWLIAQTEKDPVMSSLLDLPLFFPGQFVRAGVTGTQAAMAAQAARRGVAEAAVRVPVPAVQRAGLRLAGARPVAGRQAEVVAGQGGLAPLAARWGTMPMEQRVALAQRAGLSVQTGSAAWEEISGPAKEALLKIEPAGHREIWQMTRRQFIEHPLIPAQGVALTEKPLPMRGGGARLADAHRDMIAARLRAGQPVPANVLKDYPSLRETVPITVRPSKPPRAAVKAPAAAPAAPAEVAGGKPAAARVAPPSRVAKAPPAAPQELPVREPPPPVRAAPPAKRPVTPRPPVEPVSAQERHLLVERPEARAAEAAPPRQAPPQLPAARGARGAKPPPGDGGGQSFADVLDDPGALPGQMPGEATSRVLVRQHEGAMNAAGAELRRWMQNARNLAPVRVRRVFRGSETPEAREFILDLAERASGGRERLAIRNPTLLPYYDRLAEKLAAIEARDSAHAAEMGRELALIPDYFPDLWKVTKEGKRPLFLGGKGRPGRREFFEKRRIFATTREALDAGKEFVTYDPAQLIAIRDIAGIRRIQGDVLFQKAKSVNMVVPDVRGKVPDGWRQPQGIPAFNPKPIPHAAGEEAPLMTPGYATPEELAKRLEDYFATTGRATNPVINAMAWLAGQGKKIKVTASFFQHMDFLRRGAASKVFVGGKPLEVPGMVVETLWAATSPGKRVSLLREWTTDPFLRQVVEEGAGIVGGQSIARRELGRFVEDIKRFPVLGAIPETTPVIGPPVRLLNNVAEFVQSGLFDGVYLAQAKHFARDWGAQLKTMHSDWTERQIAAAVADNISIALSSQATWQSVFRNQGTRQFMRAFLFSSAESEGLVRGFLRMMPGSQPEARALWRKYWLGYYLMTFAVAEAVNYAVTGEFLGPEQLSPIRFTKSGRPDYNWKFLRPILGATEDSGLIYLDILGQMDTPLRWALYPPKALQNRLSVPIRQMLDQVRNAQFTGAPIANAEGFAERVWQRTQYGLKEAGTPILTGQVLQNIGLPPAAQALEAIGLGVTAIPPEKPRRLRLRIPVPPRPNVPRPRIPQPAGVK